MRTLCGLVMAFSLLAVTSGAQVGGTITGRVTAETGGLPVAGARVLVAGTSREVTTDSDGLFAFPGVGAGTHTIVITRDGFVPLSEPVTVIAGQTLTLDVRLPAAPTLTQELTVVGRISDYVDTTAGAAKTSARLIDVPQAIVVLPARLIEDIGALDTKDLYKFISGVTDSPYSSTVVRGFTQREVLVNGVKGNPYGSLDGDVNVSGFSTSQFRLTNLERVEVLKGPASVLYGSGEPGGIINYVTKKPREVFDARATIGTGGYDQALAEVEATGPVNSTRTALYRGAVYFEDRDSFRNNAATRNTHAVGAFTWRATSRTALGIEYEHIDQTNDAHRLRGVPVNAAGDFLADYEWTATEPSDFTDLDANVIQARWDQAFGARYRFDATVRYVAYDRRENYHEPRGITNNGTLMQREFRDQLRTNDDWTVSLNLAAPVTTGATKHDLAVGADVVTQDHLFRFGTTRQQNAGGPVPPLALANPVYGLTNAATYGPTAFSEDEAQTTRTGVYAQDLMTFGTRFNVLLGGRVDNYDDTGRTGNLPLEGDQTVATGRAGVVFKPVPRVALYGNVANGFARAPILSQAPSANGPHEAETSRQVELGAKTEWLEGRVQLAGAFFHIVKKNVLRPDPAFGPTGNNINAVLSTGEIRNRGLEIDLAGQLAPRWNLAFNYAYLDSSITADLNPALIGRPMPNAAPHEVGLFTRVDLPLGAAVGGSVEYVDDREEPFAGFRAPAYTVVDVHYFQQITPRLKLLVRCENLFDRQYAASALFAARAGNMPGQPRTVSVALTVASTRAPGGALRP
jgi:iron complex outermembrane recepter protein